MTVSGLDKLKDLLRVQVSFQGHPFRKKAGSAPGRSWLRCGKETKSFKHAQGLGFRV